MKTLFVLRHSLTRKGRASTDTGSHLSREGVRLARSLGDRLPLFEHVAVGDQPRHVETALALGCAFDEQFSWPSGYVDGVVAHHDQWTWSEPFAEYATLLSDGSALTAVVQAHLADWHRMLDAASEDASILVISSGGSIEPVLVAALARADHASWGSALHQLEGAALTWSGSAFDSIQMIRRGSEPVPA